MRPFLITLFGLCTAYLFAQNNIGIGTNSPSSSAKLDIASTNSGLLIPRMDSMQRMAISSPAQGLMVFQINGQKPGFYYFTGTNWVNLQNQSTGWSTSGNAGTNPSTNFIGTTDAQDLVIKVNNRPAGLIERNTGVPTPTTAFGFENMDAKSVSSGNNTVFGFQNLRTSVAGFNTAFGIQNMMTNSNGTGNVTMGYKTALKNSNGNNNTFVNIYEFFN